VGLEIKLNVIGIKKCPKCGLQLPLLEEREINKCKCGVFVAYHIVDNHPIVIGIKKHES